jgi:hypothetical protein
MKPRVCLLSPAPVWVNPRLVKEADSLHAAGYDVVVGYRADGDVSRDDAILATKRWRWHRIDVARDRRPLPWMVAAGDQRIAEWLVRAGVRDSAVARSAYCRSDHALMEWAAAQYADLYIAHTQPVLAVAALAAARRRVPFAFDCEDLLAEEAADGGRALWRRTMIRRLERLYLPRAAYVSATSAPMATYLVDNYGLRNALVWHNCAPAADAATLLDPDDRPVTAGPVELAWISATIGPGRGLEDIFAALPWLGSRVALHLYGAVPSAHAAWLESRLASLREGSVVELHPLQPADRMLVALAHHRIGLSLDADDCLNRSLTVSNKFFLYLQAGLACVATDTSGHRSVFPPGAGYGAMYPPGDVAALVSVLDRLTDASTLAAAQRAAWEVGRTRFVWDREQSVFLNAVSHALAAWEPPQPPLPIARARPRGSVIADRRCILVAPHFPPSGLPPSHRARLFARHLPTFGWTPIVVTVRPSDREEPAEPELEATVAPGLRVERVRAWPARFTRRLGIGDLALRALPALASRAIRVARESTSPVVVLVVPPWYALWLAPLLRRRAGARVIVDYVDPWRIAATGTLKSRLASWVAARSEGWCLRAVSGLFAVSDAIVDDVRARFPWVRGIPGGAAPYGFDESDLALLPAGRMPEPSGSSDDAGRARGSDGQCRVVYIGALSDAQLPVLAALLDAMVALRDHDPSATTRLRLELYGTTYAAPARAVARASALVSARGLESQVYEHPVRVPYVRALTLAAGADANLVLGDTTAYYAASKLMPVLAARRPVLAIVHSDTEPAALLRRLACRGLVCYGTADAPSPGTAVRDITSALNDLIQGRLPAMTADFDTDAALQSRTAERMTGALAAVLDRVVRGDATSDTPDTPHTPRDARAAP